MNEQISRIWRDRMPVLDGVAAATTWSFWIWAFVTVDSATRERDINHAATLIGTVIVSLAIAVLVARHTFVAKRLLSWVTVPFVGSLHFSIARFGSVYVTGGSSHIEPSDLAKMIVLAFIFFALLSLPLVLAFRIGFLAVSFAMGSNRQPETFNHS